MTKKKQGLPHIVIVGGGFGGIRTALDLAKKVSDRARITLVSENKNFEYYPGLHTTVGECRRSVTGIPLADIFEGTLVRIITDRAISCDMEGKTVTLQNAGILEADFLVLALGSQTEYFGISGLSEQAFGLKSVAQAYKLKEHIDQLFSDHAKSENPERAIGLHFVVVGAGPAGVDLAGELVHRAGVLSAFHAIPRSAVTIDVIESSSRILPMMSERVSALAEARLRKLGVNIFLNRNLIGEGSWTVFLQDMTLGAKTLIWTAGITTNEFYKKIPGIQLGKKNRVKVDEQLQPEGFRNVFIVGDAADTLYAGLAQTAIYDGSFVAQVLSARLTRTHEPRYAPKPVAYNIGIGPGWSIMVIGPVIIRGMIASWMRHLIDYKFFLSILSFKKFWHLFHGTNSTNGE